VSDNQHIFIIWNMGMAGIIHYTTTPSGGIRMSSASWNLSMN